MDMESSINWFETWVAHREKATCTPCHVSIQTFLDRSTNA